MRLLNIMRKEPFAVLLISFPFAVLAQILNWGDLWVFLLSAVAIIPLAHYIGASTEVLATHAGPRIGGLLNATLGNAAELIITIVAIREGLLELVLASITGSILGNILLVMGMAMLLGGIKNGVQHFERRNASRNAILLLLAVIALLIPSVLGAYIGEGDFLRAEALSIGAAVIMIVLYILGLVYSLRSADGPLAAPTTISTHPVKRNYRNTISTDTGENQKPTHPDHPSWSLRTAIIILAVATIGVAYQSELLVGAVEPVVLSLGISEFFLGIILIPIIGNVAEHLVAVKVAIQNQMELSVEIALASSLQIALFVAPVLVFVSLIMGNPMLLIFTEFELLALITGVIIAVFVSEDGVSNWLEGAELLAVYLILALAFFLLPA